ncbi:MAG: amidohydrolase family protein [Acidobacteriota bacterium]
MTRSSYFVAACAFVLTIAGSVLSPSPVAAAASARQPRTLVIRGGIVVDGSGSPPAGPMDVVIEGNRITQMVAADPVSLGRRGPDFERPTGDRVIDASGMYVLPGLVDMHAHVSNRGGSSEYQLKLYVANGVTAIRDVGSFETLKLKKRRAEGRLVSPRLYVYPFWPRGEGAPTNEEETRAMVRSFKERGADGIKLRALYPDILFPLADEANKIGLGTAAHLGQSGVAYANVEVASRAGVRTIEHHYAQAEPSLRRTVQSFPGYYNYLHEPDRFHHSPDPYLEADPEKFEHTIKVLLENDTVLDPTFVVYEPYRDIPRARNTPYLEEYLSPALADYWKPRLGRHGGFFQNWTSTDEAKWTEMFRRWMAYVNEFKNRGGRVTTGTDAGNSFTLYGFSNVREMELLERAGFHTLEVIRSATLESARALGESDRGWLRPGYVADLIVVEGNPVGNLKVLYATGTPVWDEEGNESRRGGVRYTIIDGVVYDAKQVLGEVAEMVRRERGRATEP